MQVLLLHIFTAFLPGLVLPGALDTFAAKIHYSPLFFIYDGYSAVYIFFVLSGVVLTGAFAKQAARPILAITARTLRLLVPAFAACLFALVMKVVVGSPNIAAGQLTGSTWLSGLWMPPAGLGFFLRDALLNSIWLGYPGVSLIGLLGGNAWLTPISEAYVAPLWTLSVELQGSLLVLILVLCRTKSRSLWWIAMAIATILFARTHFVCFIFGHAFATFRVTPVRRLWGMLLSATFLALGIYLCVSAEGGGWSGFSRVCAARTYILAPCTPLSQKVIGAMLIFAGIAISTVIRQRLQSPALAVLGKWSFSIYLVHWPIVFGVASALLLSIQHEPHAVWGRLVACAVALVLSIAAGTRFVAIDDWAIALSRRLRERVRRQTSVPTTS